MKTGGEKHDNWKHDIDWNCMTPTSTKHVKNAKKESVSQILLLKKLMKKYNI